MYTFLLILLIIDSIALVTAVLLQAGKGGGLAASFGGVGTSTDSFLGARQMGNVLTKASWWLGGIFLTLSFILGLMSLQARTPSSVLDQPLTPATTAPAPTTTAPAVPLEPAPATPQQ